jgi:hypothetical protein
MVPATRRRRLDCRRRSGMPAAPHRIRDAVDVEPMRQVDCPRRRGRPRRVGPWASTTAPQPNGKKPCDADRHAGWSHLADKAPRLLVFGGDRSEVEFAGDPSNEPRRPAGEKPTVRVGRARGGRRQCETRKRPSVRAHRRACATRQSCTREHHATVEAAPLRAASPSRPGHGVERRRPLLQPSIFVTAAAALSRSPSLRRTPCRSGRKEGLLHPSGGHTVGYCACTV